jgi:FkbM family methyltransferase
MFNQALGSIKAIESRQVIVTEKGRNGIALYGPYAEYEPGRYLVTFDITIEGYNPSHTNAIVAIIEVTAFNGNTILAKSNVYASHLLANTRRISLGFSLMDKAPLEFRVHTTGSASLCIDHETVTRKLSEYEADYSPLLDQGETPKDPFFLNNLPYLRGLYENGGCVRVEEGGTIASFSGVSFYLRNLEDFQIANEVFSHNEYNFRSSKTCVAIDIGMNTGLTSLFFANIPQVIEIYAFEPFKGPFKRAIENFGLNPGLAPKIKAYHCGLGALDERLTVFSQEQSTIGTSIKGLSSGIPEEITIRDASTELERIFKYATQKHLDIVVKVDCEGSEFAIFDVLHKKDLVKEVRVFLIEWHKWWSADRTQEDIVSCLIKSGFIVFDHTVLSQIWAGRLYAIRASA